MRAKGLIFYIIDKDGQTLVYRKVGFPSEIDAAYLDREIAKMLLKIAAEEN